MNDWTTLYRSIFPDLVRFLQQTAVTMLPEAMALGMPS